MTDLLQYEFFQNALMACCLSSLLCGIVGTYIVTRRLVFISGGITHASFGGVGVGLYTGVSPVGLAAVSAVLSAFGVIWLRRQKDMREDSAIAILWTLGMSVGIIFSFLAPGFTPDLSSYLFGSILTVTRSDLIYLGCLTVVVGLFYLFYLRVIIDMAFDEQFARSRHLPVQFVEYVMMGLIALTIVGTLRIVGIVLVIAMLTIPQTTANLFSDRFRSIMLLAVFLGMVCSVGGLLFSYYYNIPSGASIIFVSVLLYLGCQGYFFLRKKIGRASSEGQNPKSSFKAQ